MEVTLKEVEVQKLNLQPGEVLVVKLHGMDDILSMADLDNLKMGFKSKFPNNDIVMLYLPENGNVDLTVAKGSDYPNYCVDCTCGKKSKGE